MNLTTVSVSVGSDSCGAHRRVRALVTSGSPSLKCTFLLYVCCCLQRKALSWTKTQRVRFPPQHLLINYAHSWVTGILSASCDLWPLDLLTAHCLQLCWLCCGRVWLTVHANIFNLPDGNLVFWFSVVEVCFLFLFLSLKDRDMQGVGGNAGGGGKFGHCATFYTFKLKSMVLCHGVCLNWMLWRNLIKR